MRSDAVRFFCLSVCLSLLLAACSGDGGQAPPAELDDAAAIIELAALPALPPGRSFHPARITAAVTATRHGGQAVDHSPAFVTVAGVQAQFNPGPAETGFAIYEFPGSPADDLDKVEFEVSNRDPGHLVYVAISNYAHGSWEYIGVRDQDSGLATPTGGIGDYASPTGYTYVAVLAHDDGDFDLDFVRLTYANRYPVSGQVVDLGGAGINDVTITTTLGGPGVLTNAAGNFTLPAIPDGTWHLMATKPGWVFFDNPTTITVSGGPTSGASILGEMNLSHFDPVEDLEPNDTWWEAPTRDFIVPVEEFLSASDDTSDNYRFEVTTPGNYVFRYQGDHTVLFPHITLYSEEGNYIAESEWIRSGVLYIPFTLAAPRAIIAKVTCAGGGGQYTLAASIGGPLYGISGIVTAGGAEIEYACVGMDAPGELTYVYVNAFTAEYGCQYRLPVVYTVTADPLGEDPYDYWMTSPQTVDITAGSATGVNFSGSAMFLADMHEPNDTKGTAYEFASLPATTTLPANIGDTDDDDWFKVTPAAGKWLVVKHRYRFGTDQYDSRTVYMNVENHDGSTTDWAFNAIDGNEVRLGPCDGNPYFIHLWTWDNRRYGYGLSIEEYDGYKIEVGGLWGSFGIMNAQVNVHEFGRNWMQTYYTQNTGLTEIPFMFMDGETVHVEFFRYGITCDRWTDTITIDGADRKVWFRADEDESADRWEPNDSYGKLVDYPLDTDATISGLTDPQEKYVFTPLSADPLRVVFDTPADGMYFDAALYEHNPSVYLGSYSWQGDAEFLLNSSGTIMHRLEIWSYDGETSYHISIDESPGYMLSGKVLDTASNPVQNVYVYDPVYNLRWESGWMPEEDYELGPFAPGTYNIYVYAANYDSMPVSPWEVTFTNADIAQDFTLNVNVTDVGEPDDDWTTAQPIGSGVPQVLNVNNPTDPADYRMFTAGPGLVDIGITFNEWAGNVSLRLYDTDGTTPLVTSSSGVGYQRVDYFLPALGTYYICAWGGGNEYILTANY